MALNEHIVYVDRFIAHLMRNDLHPQYVRKLLRKVHMEFIQQIDFATMHSFISSCSVAVAVHVSGSESFS